MLFTARPNITTFSEPLCPVDCHSEGGHSYQRRNILLKVKVISQKTFVLRCSDASLKCPIQYIQSHVFFPLSSAWMIVTNKCCNKLVQTLKDPFCTKVTNQGLTADTWYYWHTLSPTLRVSDKWEKKYRVTMVACFETKNWATEVW